MYPYFLVILKGICLLVDQEAWDTDWKSMTFIMLSIFFAFCFQYCYDLALSSKVFFIAYWTVRQISAQASKSLETWKINVNQTYLG